ncbi:GDSL-type esterase/lipase family protein [Enterobacter hormaechei]|uniref:GDSL-type esterase/lipase family protein n=1 Tax=Enterobacter hormaechei TaxID=158836 RepID=UPI000650F90C|nr:GDSL-type esterase/lipase family protein [Enterobacter hormaechei]KLW06438.1 hypothetical protein SK45_01522 [Enterobacter hormaechei]KLW12172.1 hypothetical protein SK46_00568 [Enterobacter hormaechei]
MATTPTQNSVPSESPADLKYNAGKIDEFVTSLAQQYIDRFGNAHYTIDGLKQLVLEHIYNLGWNLKGSFQDGGTVTSAGDLLQDETTNIWYRWDDLETLPKTVPSGSTPASAGGTGDGKWQPVDVADVLRTDLAKTTGATLVNTDDGRNVQQRINELKTWTLANDSASYRAKNIANLGYVDYLVHSRSSVNILCQGDSITAGYDETSTDSVAPAGEDWARHATMTYPVRLSGFLGQQSGANVSVLTRAISGYTAKDGYTNTNWQTNPNRHLAILMYGINDSQGVRGATLDEYMEYMEKFIRRFIDWGMGVVVCIPASGGQGSGDPKWIQWGRRLRNLSEVYGCATFDTQEVFMNSHHAAVQSDAVHFNSIGYAILGEKLGSMIMAGGLLPYYKPVTNEMTTWPGARSDQIGYCDAKGNIGTGRADGTFTRAKITGILPANAAALMTFSFYLDAEAAHLYGKISGSVNVYTEVTEWWNNSAKPYYYYGIEQAMSYGMQTQRIPYVRKNFSGVDGASMFIGRIVGRGWHTITIFNEQDGSSSAQAFVNSITVSPVPLGMSVDGMWTNQEERRLRVVHCKKVPTPAGQGSTVPVAVTLTSFYTKAPQSIAGTRSVTDKLPSNAFYNTGIAKVRIVNAGGSYYEGLIVKTAGGNYNYQVTTISTNFPSGNTPTIACTLATGTLQTLIAKDSSGTNQPLENIQDANGAVISLSSSGGTALSNGFYLLFTLTWPTGSPSSYWNIEVEGTDWFGNSETAFGVL